MQSNREDRARGVGANTTEREKGGGKEKEGRRCAPEWNNMLSLKGEDLAAVERKKKHNMRVNCVKVGGAKAGGKV